METPQTLEGLFRNQVNCCFWGFSLRQTSRRESAPTVSLRTAATLDLRSESVCRRSKAAFSVQLLKSPPTTTTLSLVPTNGIQVICTRRLDAISFHKNNLRGHKYRGFHNLKYLFIFVLVYYRLLHILRGHLKYRVNTPLPPPLQVNNIYHENGLIKMTSNIIIMLPSSMRCLYILVLAYLQHICSIGQKIHVLPRKRDLCEWVLSGPLQRPTIKHFWRYKRTCPVSRPKR